MRTALLALAVLLTLALAAVAIAFLGLTPSAVQPRAAGPGTGPEVVAAAGPTAALQAPSEEPGAEEREAAETADPAVAPTSGDEPPPQAVLLARFVDPRGALLVGVDAHLEDRFGADPIPEVAQARGASDGFGRVRLELPLPRERRWRRLLLVARLEGHATLREEIDLAAGAQDLGDLVLLDAGTIAGWVLDEADRPLEGARVVVFAAGRRDRADDLGPAWPIDGETLSGPDGGFLLEAVPVGERVVGAGGADRLWSYGETLELTPAGLRQDVVLRLAPIPDDRRITLLVVDPGGQPVPGAEVSWSYDMGFRSGTGGGLADEQGRYEQLLDVVTSYSYVVSDREGRFRPASVDDVPPGTRDLVVRLGERRTLTIEVRDGAGEPVESFHASLWRDGEADDETRIGQAHERPPYAQGRVDLMVPSERFSLRVEAEGFDVARRGPFDPDAAPERVVIGLERLPGVHGRVLAEGRPLAGARVGLHAAPRGRLTVNGFDARSHQHAESSDVTDADGRFELTLRKSGTWWVRAEAEGLAPGDLGPLELDPGVGRRGLELSLGPGGAIEGRVLMPLGQSPLETIVAVSRGDGHAVTQRADAQGRFRFERLTPGPWLIARADAEIRPSTTSTTLSTGSSSEPRSNCEVREGLTTRFDLDLAAPAPVELSGQLRLSGAPAVGWHAQLSRPGGGTERVTLDDGGRFVLTSARAGSHQLTFEPSAGAAWNGSLATSLDLDEGTTPWSRDLPVGSLSGHAGAAAAPGDPSTFVWWRQGGLRFTGIVAPDAGGTYTLPVVPAGEVQLMRVADGDLVTLASGVVVAGETLELDVP